MHDLNIAETKGSGIRVMRELMQQSNLLPPTFESSRRPDQFVATFLFHHFLGPEDVAWLKDLAHDEPISDEESRARCRSARSARLTTPPTARSIAPTRSTHPPTAPSARMDLLVKKGSGNRHVLRARSSLGGLAGPREAADRATGA